MSIEDELQTRLNNLPDKRWRNNEMHKIICEFLVSPFLPDIIERNNALYWVNISKNESDSISSIDVRYEKEKKAGFFNHIARFILPWKLGLTIWYNKDGQIFVCEYYKYTFSCLADQIKEEYYKKLYEVFHVGFVVVDKTR